MINEFFQHPETFLQGSIIIAFVSAYAAGLMTSLTPCVYPVIPITVAYIGVQKSESALKRALVSIIYVLGMSVTYTALGAFAAMTGMLFGQIQSNPWLYFVIANICLIMGLSMMGFFNISIPLPAFLSSAQRTSSRGSLIGSFSVGVMSGLIVGPCTTPVLAALLTIIASQQNVALGMSLMFVFAVGMGTLLIAIGSFARLITRLPKSGTWMVWVNRIFGLILICVGEYFLIKAGTLWF